MEVREVLPPNSGRDAPPTFLSRSKLLKDVAGMKLPGEHTQRTVLNVFGQLNKQRYILDNLKVEFRFFKSKLRISFAHQLAKEFFLIEILSVDYTFHFKNEST